MDLNWRKLRLNQNTIKVVILIYGKLQNLNSSSIRFHDVAVPRGYQLRLPLPWPLWDAVVCIWSTGNGFNPWKLTSRWLGIIAKLIDSSKPLLRQRSPHLQYIIMVGCCHALYPNTFLSWWYDRQCCSILHHGYKWWMLWWLFLLRLGMHPYQADEPMVNNFE